jgi:hypothetical protein
MVHTLSLRVPEDIYRQAAEVARRRNISFNLFVQEQLQRVIEEELDRELYEAAELLGSHPEECDVSYADEAQAELALREVYDAG